MLLTSTVTPVTGAPPVWCWRRGCAWPLMARQLLLLAACRYVWLPVWVENQPQRSRQLDNSSVSVVVRWFDEWDLGVFDEPQGAYQEPVQL